MLRIPTALFAAAVIARAPFVVSPAFAYHPSHDTLGGDGSISIGVVLPIIVIVVLGMVGLGIWDRKSRKKTSKRKRKHKRKQKHKRR